ncbi:MAG TPA: VRR-NUC domain-containing protein, partial [Halioglobus sp.]
YYVENTLINSLFGLLCWEAIFTPLPGAFFHPFQHGPADLLSPDFRSVRADFLDRQLAQLDTGDYLSTIRGNYHTKHGLQSPFVYWSSLDEVLLEQALACLPPAHLRNLFERLLNNFSSNRAGLPDLIQFWPHEHRYRMIEVKGPGDRLQDNQIRWLEYCTRHDIPVTVCYVQWQDE